MYEKSIIPDDTLPLLPATAFVELLDGLYDLLADAEDTPILKTNILRLIRRVEAYVPPALDDISSSHSLEIEIGASYMPEFSRMVEQAQQQEQQ